MTNEDNAISTAELERIVRQREETLRLIRDREVAVAFDRSGSVILEKEGEIDRIRFTAEEVAKLQSAEGVIFTHNHPRGWDLPPDALEHKGASFSLSDIILAAGAMLAEMRAVGPIYPFSMQPPEAGWNEISPSAIPWRSGHTVREYRATSDIKSFLNLFIPSSSTVSS